MEELTELRWNHCPTATQRKWMTPLANMATPPLKPVSREKLTKVILLLSAALPKKSTDEMRGKTMLAVYQSQLADLTDEELEQAANKCLGELDWFPTIHQIKDRARSPYGKRIESKERMYLAKIRAILRNKSPEPLAGPISAEEAHRLEIETDAILAELRVKSKGERQTG